MLPVAVVKVSSDAVQPLHIASNSSVVQAHVLSHQDVDRGAHMPGCDADTN